MPRFTTSAILFAAIGLALASAACESCKPTPPASRETPAAAKPTPDARLYFVSDLAGQLEPCGCVKDQPGGLDHLAATIKNDAAAVRARGLFFVGPTLSKAAPVDESASEKPQRDAEARAIAKALEAMSANFALLGAPDRARDLADVAPALPRPQSVALGAQKVGTGAVSTLVFSLNDAALDAKKAATEMEAMKAAWPAPAPQFFVLLTTQGRGNAKRIAEFAPFLDAVVVGRDAMPNDENTEGFAPEQVGKTWVLEPANHGQQVAALDLWLNDGKGPAAAARQLDVRDIAGSEPSVLAVMRDMDKVLNDANAKRFASVMPTKAPAGTASYVGVKVCGSCHEDALHVWEKTGHAAAYATLDKVHKNFNLDCVGCHVTGYDRPGGSNVTHVEGLKDVQCEVCHGPGSKHAASPNTVFPVNPNPGADVCTGCHHPPHVKSFDFNEKRPLILGPGHGQPAPAKAKK